MPEIYCGCSNTCSGGCEGDCGGCTSCTGYCGNTCEGPCSAECKSSCGYNGCEGGCSGCGYGCSAVCTGTCSKSCLGTCDSSCMGSCTGSCIGCSGSCSGCAGTCSNTCSTTCAGTCDNACSSTSASDDIANLGSDITIGKFISSADFKIIKTKIENELTRRNKSNLINHYSQSAEVGNIVTREHIDKIYNDIDNSGVQRTYNVGSDNIVRASDLTNAISDIKILMLEKVNSGT